MKDPDDPEDTGDLNRDVGRRIKRFRVWVAKETQAQFGKHFLQGQSAVTQIESGTKALTVENALMLVKRFGLTLDWIYRGEGSNIRHADHDILTEVQNAILDGKKPKPPVTKSSAAKKLG